MQSDSRATKDIYTLDLSYTFDAAENKHIFLFSYLRLVGLNRKTGEQLFKFIPSN